MDIKRTRLWTDPVTLQGWACALVYFYLFFQREIISYMNVFTEKTKLYIVEEINQINQKRDH